MRKRVLGGYNGTSYTAVLSDSKYLYEGMNVIAEIDGTTGNRLRTYTWGLDWSGSGQGAGGVGGLLQTVSYGTSACYLPVFDGNGNLMALLDRAAGTLAACYEYDAFGNTLRATGSAAAGQPVGVARKLRLEFPGACYREITGVRRLQSVLMWGRRGGSRDVRRSGWWKLWH